MAARAKTLLLLLAALCLPAFAHVPRPSLVVQKPHQGVERFAQPSHRGPGDANALTAPGLARCLYDKGRRSRSTAKERDDESGLDYFGARYFGSSLGRFTSPDAPFADQKPGNPQTWNLYTYGRNNPLRYVDPTGREATVTTEIDEENNRGTIRVTATIVVYAANGSGLSSEQLAQAAAGIESEIESTFQGTFKEDGIEYTLSTDVSVTTADSLDAAEGAGAQNVIGLTNGEVSPDSNGRIENRSLFAGFDRGAINFNAIGNAQKTASHEFTHMLGGKDVFFGSPSLRIKDPNTRATSLQQSDFGVLFMQGGASPFARGAAHQRQSGIAIQTRTAKGLYRAQWGF